MAQLRIYPGFLFCALVAMAFLVFSCNSHADTLTLTTYYPSPSGDYTDMNVRGNLGIGTTSLSGTPLSIIASGAGSVNARFQNLNSNGYEGINFFDNTNTVVASFMHSNSAATRYPGTTWFGSMNTDPVHIIVNDVRRLTIDAAGNVGISDTTPTYTLDVTGTIRVTGQSYTNQAVTAWTNISDVRLKDVLGPYNKGLKELQDLNVVRFRYKKDNPLQADSTKEFMGMIAQDVQKVFPEAVLEENGYLMLNATPISWASVNAIKELGALTTNLKAENEKLKADVAALQDFKAAYCRNKKKDPACR